MVTENGSFYKKRKFPRDQQTPEIRRQNADFTDSWVTDIILVTSQWCS